MEWHNWKGLGTCEEFCVSQTLQSALESGQEARIMQIDFSTPFDGVNNEGNLSKLCYVGIGVYLLYIIDTVSIKLISACYGGWLSD